jgi:hypothetical protein
VIWITLKEYTNQEIRFLEESGLDLHYKYRIPEAIYLTNPFKQTLEFSLSALSLRTSFLATHIHCLPSDHG